MAETTDPAPVYVTEADAIEAYQGVIAARSATRLKRYEKTHKTHRSKMAPEEFVAAGVVDAPEQLPDDSERELYTIRIPVRLMSYVRAKGNMEDLDVNHVILNALEAYTEAPVDTSCVYLTQKQIEALPEA